MYIVEILALLFMLTVTIGLMFGVWFLLIMIYEMIEDAKK